MQSPSSCPWKTSCTSKVNDSVLGGTFVRWEESTLPWWVLSQFVTVSVVFTSKIWYFSCGKQSLIHVFNKRLCHTSLCSSLVLDEVEKQSTCELEVDAVAADILNRLEIQSKNTPNKSNNSGQDMVWPPFHGEYGPSGSCVKTTFRSVTHQHLLELTEKMHTMCPIRCVLVVCIASKCSWLKTAKLWKCHVLMWFNCDVYPDQIGRNPGLQAIWEDEKQRRRENNKTSQITNPDSQGEQNHSRKCP